MFRLPFRALGPKAPAKKQLNLAGPFKVPPNTAEIQISAWFVLPI
jgi:hypothetical protein